MKMYSFYTILSRDFLNIIKNPVLLFYNTIFPFLFLLILGYLTNDMNGNQVKSYDYYGVTILLLSVLNVSITAANSFMERSVKRSNLRILYAPIPTSFLYGSKIVATFLFTSICFLVLMGIEHLVLGVHFGGNCFVWIMCMMLALNLFSSILGVLFCCVFKSEEVSNSILSMVNNVFAILGGLLFPLDGLGRTVQIISYFSPVKWVAEGMFKVIYDHDLHIVLPTISVCLGLSVICFLLCKLTFRTEDYV